MTAIAEQAVPWQKLAVCTPADWGLFFGPDGETPAATERRERKAKQVCTGCPVLSDCLGHALDANIKAGVWGGMGEGERAALRQNVMRRRREKRQEEGGAAA